MRFPKGELYRDEAYRHKILSLSSRPGIFEGMAFVCDLVQLDQARRLPLTFQEKKSGDFIISSKLIKRFDELVKYFSDNYLGEDALYPINVSFSKRKLSDQPVRKTEFHSNAPSGYDLPALLDKVSEEKSVNLHNVENLKQLDAFLSRCLHEMDRPLQRAIQSFQKHQQKYNQLYAMETLHSKTQLIDEVENNKGCCVIL